MVVRFRIQNVQAVTSGAVLVTNFASDVKSGGNDIVKSEVEMSDNGERVQIVRLILRRVARG